MASAEISKAKLELKVDVKVPVELPTPSPSLSSGETSPTMLKVNEPTVGKKKKKKKKPKKSAAKAKEAATLCSGGAPAEPESRPPVLCISRNKHWRYISSYHGPWLQLPLELLESLLVLNLDPNTLNQEPRSNPAPSPNYRRIQGAVRPPSPTLHSNSSQPSFPNLFSGKTAPPPIDPGVFRSVTSIRKLIDEAAELSVRAASGVSSTTQRASRGSNNNTWASMQTYGAFGGDAYIFGGGTGSNGGGGGGGRTSAMSAMRVNRLRALAVQKLAQAYKTDEIASSVMVMQGGNVFDDVAERVLKVDPNDSDAKYVHFFHERIPSRQLAESTTTKVLDELIAAQPQRLEYFRTRGLVHCFRDEYVPAARDFTHALKEARALRKARTTHSASGATTPTSEQRPKRKKKGGGKANGSSPLGRSSSLSDLLDDTESESTTPGPPLHPSALPTAPDPIEPQLLFLRGTCHLQHAIFLVETAVLALEGVRKPPGDQLEMRLTNLVNGKYGGVEMHSEGPLGARRGPKESAYRSMFVGELREKVSGLAAKAVKDIEKFLGHFDSLEGPNFPTSDIAQRLERAYILSCPTASRKDKSKDVDPFPNQAIFTTYHPLLVEAHFTILLAKMVLGDFVDLVAGFARAGAVVGSLEGYPVFLPPRSMAQAEFVEILERLAAGWRAGVSRGKGRLTASVPTGVGEEEGGGSGSSSSGNGGGNGGGSGSGSGCGSGYGEVVRVREDAPEALECARMLLAPVVAKQRAKAEAAASERTVALSKAGAAKKNGNGSLSISIPLHGPRVDVVLAWLGGAVLPELE